MSLKNPVTPPGIDPGTVRLVAQRLNHYATPGPKYQKCIRINVQRLSEYTHPLWRVHVDFWLSQCSGLHVLELSSVERSGGILVAAR